MKNNLKFINLIQIPYFVEQYLIYLMTTQEETFKINDKFIDNEDIDILKKNKDENYKKSYIKNNPINNQEIITKEELNDLKNKISEKGESFFKNIKDKSSVEYLFINYKNLIVFNEDNKGFVIYLPLSSFLAMIKPADSSYAGIREELEFQKIRKGRLKPDRLQKSNNKHKGTYFLGYYVKEVNSILVGTVRYIYDTIRDNLHFLFSTSDTCNFHNIYLKKMFSKLESEEVEPNLFMQNIKKFESKTGTSGPTKSNVNLDFKRKFITEYLKFTKSYGLYDGLANLVTPLVYIISIYIDHLNLIIKHLLDLKYLNNMFKEYVSTDSTKDEYLKYYEQHYYGIKNKARSTQPTSPESNSTTSSTSSTAAPPSSTAAPTPPTDTETSKNKINDTDLLIRINSLISSLKDTIVTGNSKNKKILIYNEVLEFVDQNIYSDLPTYTNLNDSFLAKKLFTYNSKIADFELDDLETNKIITSKEKMKHEFGNEYDLSFGRLIFFIYHHYYNENKKIDEAENTLKIIKEKIVKIATKKLFDSNDDLKKIKFKIKYENKMLSLDNAYTTYTERDKKKINEALKEVKISMLDYILEDYLDYVYNYEYYKILVNTSNIQIKKNTTVENNDLLQSFLKKYINSETAIGLLYDNDKQEKIFEKEKSKKLFNKFNELVVNEESLINALREDKKLEFKSTTNLQDKFEILFIINFYKFVKK